jgi:hypothetical protein
MRNLKWLFVLPVLMLGTLASAAPTLNFDINWNEWSSPSPLVHGTTPANVIYDANRLPQCRGNLSNGSPGWTITGFYKVNGGAVQSFWVAGFSSVPNPPAPSIPLTTSGALTVWFQVTSVWGCSAYDSDFGANYHFSIN